VANVWVVEEGEYSDYHVVGVFSTKEAAQLVWDALNEAGGDPREGPACWTLDPLVDQLRAGLRYYEVKMLVDGTTESCKLEESFSDWETQGPRPPWFAVYKPRVQFARMQKGYPGTDYSYLDTPDYLIARVWAKDAQGAVKATNEHRARLIANNEW
jgi:hypothetical protein